MPKRKKRTASKKKKDDSPDEVSECESLDRPPSAKKVAAASSTSQLDDEMDQISTFSSVTLHNTSTSGSGELALLLCNFCSFTAETKTDLGAHMRQHMTKCPHCSFSSLSRIEVTRHCKYEHDKDIEGVTSEVDSSSTECEMDKDPCSACVFCNFMTYSTEHLEKHTAYKHPGMLAKSVAKMITKQISAEVRKDDYLFYLVISNEGQAGLSQSSSAIEKPQERILIDVSGDKTEDVKPEVKDTPDTKPFQQKLQFLDPVKIHFDTKPLSSLSLGEKVGNRDPLISSTVKVEAMYCLTCSYSNVYIEKLKCHTIVQHPVGAAVATYNSTGESVDAQDVTFFCVREDCSHSSSDCSAYQKHLMDCCACQKTLKVLERERLRSTITFILDYHKKYKLSAIEGFFDFASPFLGFSLPPSLTGISSVRVGESSTYAKVERSVNSPQSSVANTENTLNSSSLITCLTSKSTCNQLTSETESYLGSKTANSHPLNINQSFPQHSQDTASNIHLTGSNNVNFDNSIVNSSDPINTSVQVSSTNTVTEGRTLQPGHNHDTQASLPFHAQNESSFQQPSQTQRNYQEPAQSNINWITSNEREASSMISVPAHSQQNFDTAFHNQHVEDGSRLVLHDNTVCSSTVSQSKPDTLSVVPSVEVSHSFLPEPVQNTYAQTFTQGSLDSVNTLHMNANMVHRLDVESHDAATNNVSNPMTNLAFYGQQQHQPNNIYSTADVDTTVLETQPQPKMLDLLSDSYSILLSDEFGPENQVQELGSSNLIQPQASLCQPSYHQSAPILNAPNQTVVSQSSSLMSQGHSTVYQPMQQEESNFQQPLLDNSLMLSHGNQLPFPSPTHGSQLVNVMPNLGSESDFQTAQSSSSYGAAQNTLAPETVCSQLVPHHQPNVPNFLVAPGVPTSETAPVQQHTTTSFFNPRPGAIQSAIVPSAPFTPPKSANTVNRFASASPLSPSIYLSGHSPRHKRTDWTVADMRPRGIMLQPVSPRNMISPMSAPGTKSQVSQRLFAPGRRGYPRPPRMPSGRGRLPAPRISNNRVGGGGEDDDDVILTAVTRLPSSGNQQLFQQSSGRLANRGSTGTVLQGRGQALSVQNRQRGPISGARLPYPVTSPLHQLPKQFDISKHFEDLACVVNSSADEVGNDDIEIVCVTPGDKDKPNQSKAVDASKFSFCCVHCGKDQGSKNVMKQHMKARHNDSLLGAFTNTETGQLLFFCPQLTCEFMTYDEKRLCEHLSKCFDFDRSKPFDFGTAIKNLKSLKIRQLDVRTMGKSHDNPIDLDGHGMKDNFTSSLNDAFGDIVVNASGRHIVRNTTASNQTLIPNIRHPSMPTNTGSIRNKVPVRNQVPISTGQRSRLSGFTEQADLTNRFSRPPTTFRLPRQQNPDVHIRGRQAASTNIRMSVPNVKDIHPRIQTSVGQHRLPLPRGAPPFHVSTPRLPSGDQHDPVIVIDADSPERPDEIEQNKCVLNERLESNQTPVRIPISVSENLPARSNEDIIQSAETINTDDSQKQHSLPGSQDSVLNQAFLITSHLSPSSHLPRDDSTSDSRMATVQSSVLFNQPSNHFCDTLTSNNPDSELDSVSAQVQQSNVNISHTNSCPTSGLASTNSFRQNIDVSKITNLDSSASANLNLSSDRVRLKASSYLTDAASCPTFSETESQKTKCSTVSSGDTPTSSLPPSSTSLTPASSHLSTVSLAQSFDEEERVNAVVLEKVFAKVPNMPKNLSCRLVAKFKEYARYRGVRITSDSKVIDEFVSKIYYKGSPADKGVNKTQPVQHTSSVQPGGNSEHSITESSTNPGNIATKKAECEYVYSRESTEDQRKESMQEDVTLKGKVVEQQTIVNKDSLVQTAENDVITTQVILAQTNLEFSPTFASIALKSLSSTKMREIQPELGLDQNNLTSDKVTEQLLTRSYKPDVAREFTSVASRRNSASDASVSKVAHPVRRSSSFPQPVHIAENYPKALSHEHLPEKLVMDAASPVSSSLNVSPNSNSSQVSSEVCTPSKGDLQQEYQLICNEETDICLPSTPKSDTVSNVIASSVQDIVSKHPALEVDIAGIPCIREQFDQSSKQPEINSQNTVKGTNEGSDQVLPKKEKRFGLVKRSLFPNIDKKTGMLLLKKTKARTRKPFINKEETPNEIKTSTAEELVIRRSSRSRKPVNKDYQSETNEIDDLMSDDDDEYNVDDDDDTDTDNEWHGGNSEQQQPPRKRIRKIIPPPDPTAFDVTTKGKFKCWLCRKVFSRCSFAKSHIVQKHEAGLCAVHLDKSEEQETLFLLLFCPRQCRYTTLSLDGIKSHIESCSQPLLQDGEKFLEISKQFLNSTCSELQSMSLEAILNRTKTRKAKDPTKPLKVKKPKEKVEKPAVGPVVIKLISDGSEADNVLVSSILPCTSSSNAAAAISAVINQTASSARAILPDDQVSQMQQSISSIILNTEKSSQAKAQYPQNLSKSINTHVQGQHTKTITNEGKSSHFTLSNLSVSAAPFHAVQQISTAGKPAQAGSSFPQQQVLSHVNMTTSSVHDDDLVYVIEDNGTICLK